MSTSQVNLMSAKFLEILNSHGLHQYIEGPTHKKEHTLDLIISNPEDNIIDDWQILPSLGLDHMLINCIINYEKKNLSLIESFLLSEILRVWTKYLLLVIFHRAWAIWTSGGGGGISVDGMLETFDTAILKKPGSNPLGVFQSYYDFGTIRIVIFFWSSFWNFTPLFLVVHKKTSKTWIFYWLRW